MSHLRLLLIPIAITVLVSAAQARFALLSGEP